jgi:Na+-transporting methylmalonyl-CoA/oxaloacetate decarboxylase gamma subunit
LFSEVITDSPNVFELLQASISQNQILLTLALGLVVAYWLMVIFGILNLDSESPDVLMDGDGLADVSHDPSSGSVWLSTSRVLGFSKVPIVVWMSFLILFMWFISLVFNRFWNPDATTTQALLLLAPNFLISAIITKIVTIPVGKLFSAMSESDPEAKTVLGRIGTVVSTEADESYGQVQIVGKGAPLLINVRTRPGTAALKKGASVILAAAGPDHKFYYIESYQS